jgi:hypothetical protein
MGHKVKIKDFRILESDTIYVIAEYAIVINPGDGDGLENEEEPVVCLPLGCWIDRSKAEKKCNKLNKNWEPTDIEDSTSEEHFVVKELKLIR